MRGNNKAADQYKIERVPTLLVTDADGDEICRGLAANEATISRVLDTALEKYKDTPIAWGNDPSGAPASKLLVIGFDTEKEDGLKALEDKTLVKFHDRCTFVKLPYEKGGETAKAWGVSTTPTIVLCDPSKETPAKQAIERLSGKKTPRDLKSAILRALRKIETAQKAAAK